MPQEKALLEEANSTYGLHIKQGSPEYMKAVELQRTKLVSLEEYNAPIYVYRITKKGKEYLREIEV